MAGPQQFFPNMDSQNAIINYAQRAQDLLQNQFSLRSAMEDIDRDYIREHNWTDAQIKSRIANRRGDARKFQDITVPIIMPQVRAALGYLANVFLMGYPIFGVSADPQNEAAALQMSTVIAENAVTAGWARQLLLFFNDGLKYNLHGVELEWQQKTTTTVETTIDPNYANGAKPKNIVWCGNVLRRMDLYNTFFDPRVHPSEIYCKGEFAGYIEMYSRVAMKEMINNLFGRISADTAKRAFESSPISLSTISSGTPFGYYVPVINPFPILSQQNLQTFDWMSWAGAYDRTKNIKYSNVYQVTTLYARIIPDDFNMEVKERNTPQIWKFKIVNGQVLIFAERQPNFHNFLPIFFGQPLEDGLDFQTKSFAQNVQDLQFTASAMWNGYMAHKRRLVGDRVLYDPQRIAREDINSREPAAKIPVRPAAYGKPLSDAVYQFPFRDEQTQSLLDGAARVSAFADKVNGINAAQQGSFVKGNKTREEFNDIMARADGNNQLMAIMTENQVFIPLKEGIKLNIMQLQPATDMYNRDEQQQVAINPVDLRKAAIHFKVSDGLEPTEKQLSTDEFIAAMQAIGSNPNLGAGYDVGDMFAYIMEARGADLSPFKIPAAQQQSSQQINQLMSIVTTAVEKGIAPPTSDDLKNWEAFAQWSQQVSQQIQQQADKQAQQQQQPGASPNA